LLGSLFGESVARADLVPSGAGLAGGVNLGDLQVLCDFSETPGGFESAKGSVGGVECIDRRGDPLDKALGGHDESVSTADPVNDMLISIGQRIVDEIPLSEPESGVIRVAKKSKKGKK